MQITSQQNAELIAAFAALEGYALATAAGIVGVTIIGLSAGQARERICAQLELLAAHGRILQ